MIKLPFECYCTELKVHPKNWQLPKALMKKDCYVYWKQMGKGDFFKIRRERSG